MDGSRDPQHNKNILTENISYTELDLVKGITDTCRER